MIQVSSGNTDILRLITGFLKSGSFIFWITPSLFVFLSIITPGFFSVNNILNILSSSLPLMILCTGQTFVLITGGIDLSIMSIVALTSIVGSKAITLDQGWLCNSDYSVLIGIIIMLLCGAICGFLNGIIVAFIQGPPFIVTLSTMILFSGIAIWSTMSSNIYNLPPAFCQIGSSLGLSLIFTILIIIMANTILQRTPLGKWLYAVGSNIQTSFISGVPIKPILVFTYAFSGFCAACASILLTGKLETGSPVLGERMLLDVIGATVIAGISLYGGRGKITWAIFGVLLFTIIDNSLNLLNFSFFSIMITKGIIIFIAAFLDSMRTKLIKDLS